MSPYLKDSQPLLLGEYGIASLDLSLPLSTMEYYLYYTILILYAGQQLGSWEFGTWLQNDRFGQTKAKIKYFQFTLSKIQAN